MTTNRQPRSLSSKLIILAAAAFLITVGALLVLLFSRRSNADAEITALRQAGAPTTGAELNDYYRVPDGVTNSTAVWAAATAMVSSPGFSESVKGLPILGRGEEVVLPGEEWPQLDESRTALETTLAAELAAVRAAAKVGGQVRFPVDFRAGINATLTDTQEMRSLVRLLLLDAHVAAHDGDSQRVIGNIHDIITTSDTLAGEPCLISQLVRVATRNMGIHAMQDLFPHCEWSDESLAKLQDHLMQSDLRNDVCRALIGERAITISTLKTTYNGPFRADNELLALEIYENQLNALGMSWAEALQKNQEVDDKLGEIMKSPISKMRYSGVAMLVPAFSRVNQAVARSEALSRATTVALAMQRHKLKHGDLPKTLTDIAADCLPGKSPRTKLMTDPFTGKQMLLRQIEGGVVVYSVGPDQTDDGGSVLSSDKAESRSQQLPDVGFQLVLPKE